MSTRITWAGATGRSKLTGPGFGLAAVGPEATIGAFKFERLHIAFHGHPHWREAGVKPLEPIDVLTRLARAYRDQGADALKSLGGDFAVAIIDLEAEQAILAIDRIGVRNLVYRLERGVLVFAANLDSLAAHPAVSHRVDPQGLYNYVYFHMVPGPETIFERSRRLLPGHYALVRAGSVTLQRYWAVEYNESSRPEHGELKRLFRSTLRAGVRASARDTRCGTFLSGGTDSSTVAGVLSELRDDPVDTYSIGFDASGYDEMEYARMASRHFRTRHHEYYVTPADVVAALPLIADEYDQPFGNASAVPTFYCATLARNDGIERMLAGDGGDELFGGNSRYAKQHQLSLYERVPYMLRSQLLEPMLRLGVAGALPLLRKARSYVEQARVPMPARYNAYNLLDRLGPAVVFEEDFLATVDREHPLALMTDVYASTQADSLINRMLAIDLKFTLADNDLPKVTRMCDRAGVDVAFPLLHDAIVDFSAGLPPQLKLKGTQLRYFFKEALRDFLPAATIAKQKHGFGLPAGPWLATYEPLRDIAREAIASLGRRAIFRREFLDTLIEDQLREHTAYYGTMVWVLLMLELWFQRHVDT